LPGNKITAEVTTMTTPALVLHLTATPEPAVFALSPGAAKSLAGRMSKLMGSGAVETVELADSTTAAINFGHVATAHIEDLPPHAKVYGAKARAAGLGHN
jgi:hypothetical protein